MLQISKDVRKTLVKYILPIELENIDYYQFGLNTRIIIGDDTKLANEIITSKSSILNEIDLFFEGYWNGVNNII